MELIQLTPSAYQLLGGSNAGLIVRDGRAVLVDTGLDRDTAKKILRAADSLSVRLAAVLITHAHADHFGGAALIRARTGAPVYAPSLEAAIISNPILEPLYLFSGAAPISDLRHKFTLAEPCPVDNLISLPAVGAGELVIGDTALQIIPAPGHAPNQVMIGGGGACFMGDACFAPEVLNKHGIPFYVDVDRTAATLAALPGLDESFAAFVPGHGPAAAEIAPWARENAARLAAIREAVAAGVDHADDLAHILQSAASRFGLTIANPVIYCLTQTTVLACLSSIHALGQVEATVIDNRLCWKRSDFNVV